MLGCSQTCWSSLQWMKACLTNLVMFCFREKSIGLIAKQTEWKTYTNTILHIHDAHIMGVPFWDIYKKLVINRNDVHDLLTMDNYVHHDGCTSIWTLYLPYNIQCAHYTDD